MHGMARKSKLEQILEQYSEKEIRQICAESSSRTDFAKKLGLHWRNAMDITQRLIDSFNLDISHFQHQIKNITKEQILTACKNAYSYKDIAQNLGLTYKNESSLNAAIYRLLRKYDINWRFLQSKKIEQISKGFKKFPHFEELTFETVMAAYKVATSYKEMAELCGCDVSPNKMSYLSTIGKNLILHFDLDPNVIIQRRKMRKSLSKKTLASWRYSYGHKMACSQCGNDLEKGAFLLTDTKEKRRNILSYILCERCHASNKKQQIRTCNLTNINENNGGKQGIYLIRYKIDGRLYVGKTETNFNQRICEHLGVSHPTTDIDIFLSKHPLQDFDFFIIEILDEKPSSFFLEREQYWISYFGSDNSLLGFNNYSMPRNTDSVLSDEDVKALIRDIKTLSISHAELAEKYHISKALVGEIKQGRRRRQLNEKYPIRAYNEQQHLNKIIKCIELLAEGQSFKDIAQQLEISDNTVRKYNQGKFPIRFISVLHERYLFPIQQTKKVSSLNKKQRSEICEKNASKTKENCSSIKREATIIIQKYSPTAKMLEDGLDTIILKILDQNIVTVAKEYKVSDNYIRKLLRKHNLPTKRNEMFLWLDEHPELESAQRIPSREELLLAITNLRQISLLLDHYNITRSRFDFWLDFRNIKHNFKKATSVMILELGISFPTINDAARFLIRELLTDETDAIKIARDIGHAIERKQGAYSNWTFCHVV